MPIYNLIEYSDNYSDISGSLWGFKRDEITNNADVTNDGSALSFKYKASLIAVTEADGTKEIKNSCTTKIFKSFLEILEMPLIKCKVKLLLKWIENCVLNTAEIGANADATGADSATLEVTDAKLYVPGVTLSAEDNVKLVKQLNEGFKRPVYWNKYKVTHNKVVEIAAANAEKHIRELLDSSYEGFKRLFVLAYDNAVGNKQVFVDSFKEYFLPRVKIKIWNIKIDGRNFYDQPINDSIKQYDEIRKISTGQGDDYTTGCLLDFAYFEKNYRLIAADLSKEKALDADSRAFQQIKSAVANTSVTIYYILEHFKETILQFSKGTTKVL